MPTPPSQRIDYAGDSVRGDQILRADSAASSIRAVLNSGARHL